PGTRTSWATSTSTATAPWTGWTATSSCCGWARAWARRSKRRLREVAGGGHTAPQTPAGPAPGEGSADRGPPRSRQPPRPGAGGRRRAGPYLLAGTRWVPSSDADLVGVAALDLIVADSKLSRAAPFAAGSTLPVLLNVEE